MHNQGNVFRFEVTRTLKKKSFWITALSFPVIILAVFAVIFFSNQASDKAAEDIKKQSFSLAVTDDSKLVSPDLLKAVKASVVTDKQAAIGDVESGKLDAYVYYPKDLSKSSVEIYAKNVTLFDNGRYQTVAKSLLDQTVLATTTPELRTILQDRVNFETTTYKDGKPYNGFKELIAPGVFLILFWALIAMFGSQMLASTTEEKENRVIEMILTTIQARTLIIGKILSLIVLAGVQMLVILIPTIIAYIFLNDALSLPNFDLSNLPLDPVRISIGALIFVTSFLLFTGILVGIGAATPTAKEASGFFGTVMVFMFGPLYAVTLFVSSPDAAIVKFLSFFPLTAPIPLMLRNAVGNLSLTEAIIGIAILAVSAVISLAISIRLFRYGALEYSRRLSLKSIFAKKSL
jgi:ABC-2 type transport system permease protein